MNFTDSGLVPENFIFDLDGVVWRGMAPVPGAVESILRLRAAGKRCFYCTNNSSETQDDFAARLRAIGLQLEPEEVINSAWATAQFLRSELPESATVFVVGAEGLRDTLREHGLAVMTNEEADSGATADCVVAGIDRQFSYAKLARAQAQILRGARFVATNRDATFPVENGVMPGAGSIVAAIVIASGAEPFTVGKPEPLMLQLCVKTFGLDAARTVMIGDRLDTDIACAHRAGLRGFLVTTGVNSRADGESATGDEKPDAIYEDLPALSAMVLSN